MPLLLDPAVQVLKLAAQGWLVYCPSGLGSHIASTPPADAWPAGQMEQVAADVVMP